VLGSWELESEVSRALYMHIHGPEDPGSAGFRPLFFMVRMGASVRMLSLFSMVRSKL